MKNKIRYLITGLLLALTAIPVSSMAGAPDSAEYVAQMNEWRQARHDRLSDPDGWMTLVGMEWLNEGENSVGSDESSDARIPGGPGTWGTVFLRGDELRFMPAPGADVTVDGEVVAEAQLQVAQVAHAAPR